MERHESNGELPNARADFHRFLWTLPQLYLFITSLSRNRGELLDKSWVEGRVSDLFGNGVKLSRNLSHRGTYSIDFNLVRSR